MAGLSDMEELIATVPERHVADYLKEAMSCYGAGAHRACIVLAHIALFDGLRQKLLALAPVNSVAKSISDEIEALAGNQKVFETPLIHKMKTALIITQLEADILEQINKQRNKAAHPSGHLVTPEEARFVFSEVIQKFLSQPIRQTSVIVDQIMDKLGDANFFPGRMLPDMKAVVDQETANLDPSAMPALISKLAQKLDDPDATTQINANNFVLALTGRQDAETRKLIVKHVVDPKSLNVQNAEMISQIATTDPEIIGQFSQATKLRCRPLFLTNAQTVGVHGVYNELRHPAHLLGAAVSKLGGAFMLAEYGDFTNWVVAQAPRAPDFITALAQADLLFTQLLDQYLEKAAHSTWDISNPFATALPSMDVPLATSVSNEWAFKLVAAVARGAAWNGFGPLQITNNRFNDVPVLKAKAIAHTQADAAGAALALAAAGVQVDLPTFITDYF